VAQDPQAPYKDYTLGTDYNGIATIKQKTSLALQQAGGIMIWELSQDTRDATSLLKAINDVIIASPTALSVTDNKDALAFRSDDGTNESSQYFAAPVAVAVIPTVNSRKKYVSNLA
jgi:hypothetical protein